MIRDYNLDNLRNFMEQLEEKLPSSVNVSTSWGEINEQYQNYKNSQVFNRRLQFAPLVIVYCETEDDVKITFNAVKDNNLPFTVRAGGHDHEGECIGTNTVLIDVSKINHVDFCDNSKIAKIGPGNRFETLTSTLAKNDVMIAHGTCATVGIAGFTMGGGWGPWTRKEGMCCEHLIGANILLGNGEIEVVDVEEDGTVPPLLWALRGGGGLSYGIVTELRFETFPLPDVLHRFEIQWNPYENKHPDTLCAQVPTIAVLKKWEALIAPFQNPSLIGTNLKINAIPFSNDQTICLDSISHNCVFYGYWEGDEASLNTFITDNFTDDLKPDPCNITIEPATGAKHDKESYGKQLMGSWDRESFSKIQLNLGGTPLQPDEDDPAPHKITSRLVDEHGLGQAGYQQLLQSLSSPLIQGRNRERGLFTYVTLGAITGDYYPAHANNACDEAQSNCGFPKYTNDKTSAFPYKNKRYTIQYQCWWNEEANQKALGQDNRVYDNTNRALDWIETARKAEIPGTSGAFISFKDNSIPTETYFATSYRDLKEIKESYSLDPFNHFRSRKTII